MRVLIFAPEDFRSITLFLPVLKKLKLQKQATYVTVVANSKAREVLSCIDYYNEIIGYKGELNSYKNYSLVKRSIAKNKYDYLLNFNKPLSFYFQTYLRRIPRRVGIPKKLRDYLFYNKKITFFNDHIVQHSSLLYLSFTKGIGDSHLTHEQLKITFDISEEEKQNSKDKVSDLLKTHQKIEGERIIFVHLSQADFSPHWSSRNYARLIKRMSERYPFLNFIVYSEASDEEFAKSYHHEFSKEYMNAVKGNVLFLTTTQIQKIKPIDVLKGSDLFFGHNSGYLHLSHCLGIPSVALSNPIRKNSIQNLSPFKFDPSEVKILLPQVICGEISTCSGIECPYFDCMSKLEVKTVMAQIVSLLQLNELKEEISD